MAGHGGQPGSWDVLEIASPSTWREDQTRKRELYQWMGVAEYWQYDPSGEHLEPELQGLELVEGEYEPMAWWETEAGLPAAASEVLGLELHVTAERLRFWDAETEQYLLSRAEEVKARVKAEAERDAEKARADAETKARAEAEARADVAAEANAALAAQIAELKAS